MTDRDPIQFPVSSFWKGKVFRALTLLILAACATTSLTAELRVPSLFTDHMVLQRDQLNKVWGWDDPGTMVTVTFGGSEYPSEAGPEGKWMVELAPSPANAEPQTLVVEGTEVREITDVLVGDVWICSGQSNMQWSLDRDWYGDVNALAAENPFLRLITVPHVGTQELQDDFEGQWVVSSPEEARPFSAVGYYFGSQLQHVLDIPIGLIDNAWGGSAAEAWIRRDILEAEPRFQGLMDRTEAKETETSALPETDETKKARGWLTGNNRAGNIYSGVLHPTIGFGIKGVIWYQGESNTSRAEQYRELFPFLIKHWRSEWDQGDFPFYWVQLADFKKESAQPQESAWAELREAQTKALALPNTGQAVIIDLGEGRDIHPRKKYAVASRLVRWALVKDYGYDLAYRSPEYVELSIRDGKAAVTIDCFGSSLRAYGTKEVQGFAICGADRIWHWGEARLLDGNTVEVSSKAVLEPVAVRYAWADNPVCNLISAEGLPVTPFRTDDFAMITEKEN